MFKIKREIEICIAKPLVEYTNIKEGYMPYFLNVNCVNDKICETFKFNQTLYYIENHQINNFILNDFELYTIKLSLKKITTEMYLNYLNIYSIDNSYILTKLLIVNNTINNYNEKIQEKIGEYLSLNTNDIAVNYLLNNRELINFKYLASNTNDNAVNCFIKYLMYNDDKNNSRFQKNTNDIAVNYLVNNPKLIKITDFLHNPNDIAVNYIFNNLDLLDNYDNYDYDRSHLFMNFLQCNPNKKVKNYHYLLFNPHLFTNENFNNHDFYLQFTQSVDTQLCSYTSENIYTKIKEAYIDEIRPVNYDNKIEYDFLKFIYKNIDINSTHLKELSNSDDVIKLYMDYKIDYKKSYNRLF